MKLASNFSLPPNAPSHTIAIIGQKGSGKTYTARLAVEQMREADAQVIVLDPTGAWSGLRSSAEGKGKGINIIIMGGNHGDVPLEPSAGQIIADWIVDSGHSAVLDFSMFNSKAEEIRFVTAFMERLYRRKAASEHKTALHIVIDEADNFAPQRPMPGEQAMLGSIITAVRRGRSRGLGITMITQRPAALSKEVLTQADLLIALRVVGKQDHDALSAWTNLHGTAEELKQFKEGLASLPVGEAFFWSPGWLQTFKRGKVLKCKTYDSSATPEPGKARMAPKLSDVDLTELSDEIRASMEKARENDPKELKREITRLHQELAKAQKEKPSPAPEVKEVPVPIREEYNALLVLMNQFREASAAIFEKADKVLSQDDAKWSRPQDQLTRTPAVSKAPTPAPAPKASPAPTSMANGTISSAELRVLKSLYWLKDEERTPVKVAFFANYTVNGHFNNVMGGLRSKGYVQAWSITNEGIHMLPGDIEGKPTGPQLREWLRLKLSVGENRILDTLIKARGERVAVEILAQQSDYTVNGHFNNCLGKLRTLQIAEGGAREGGVKAADLFFS